ncbi:MAG: hypothetical protein ACRC37_04740 [Lentisphaeria bacterium]
MKFSRREFITFVAGAFGLGALFSIIINKFKKPTQNYITEKSTFIIPDYARNEHHALNGIVFTTNREKRTVCAHDEKTKQLLWESYGEDKFIIPGAAFPIDLSSNGELWVANVGKKRLEQLDPKTGKFIASWEPRESFGGCCNPVRFATLSNGRFVTMEKGSRVVAVYSPSGEKLKNVTNELSNSEFNYFLGRSGEKIMLFDSFEHKSWEVL